MPDREVNTYCSPHCFDTCCEFVVTVRDGRAVKLKKHPEMKYAPCPKGWMNVKRLYHPDRLKYPMERVGERGEGKWRRISWDEALEKIAAKLNQVKVEHGNESVAFYEYMGQISLPDGRDGASLTIERLLNLWGGCIPVYQRGSLCWQALISAQEFLYGNWKAALPYNSECQTIILWGTNPAETASKSVMPSFREAKKKGAKFIVIDPVLTNAVRQLDATHIPIRPGTDLAMALAMMNVIITEGLYSKEYILEHTNAPFLVRLDNGKLLRWHEPVADGTGDYVVWDVNTNAPQPCGVPGLTPALSGEFDINGIQCQPAWQLLTDHVMGWTPERAEPITGVPAEQIGSIARALSTNKPAKIFFSSGAALQRASWGENSIYGLALLNVVSGNFRGTFAQLNRRFPTVDIGFNEAAWTLAIPNPIKKRIPISHLAEAILNPARYGTNIKALLVMWGNPVNQHANSNKTIEALKSKSLELIVVADIFMTATARYADILLPVSTFLERTSLYEGSEVGRLAYTELLDTSPKPQIYFRERAIEPLYESKDDFEIVCLLAKKLGYGEFFPWKNTEEWIADVLERAKKDSRFPWLKSVTMELLRKEGIVNVDAPYPKPTWKLNTPSRKVEIYNERLLDKGYDPLPVFREPEEGSFSTPDLYQKYPLNLVSPHSRFRAHSSFSNQPELLKSHSPEVLIHAADAQQRGINNGDLVSVYNDRGRIQMKASVSEDVRPGVIRIYEGGWPEHGMVNLLTSDRLTTYGENPTYNTCLVEVTKVPEEDKPVE